MIYRIVPGLYDPATDTVPGFTIEEVEPGVYRRVARQFRADEVFAPDGSYCGAVDVPEGHL